MKRRALVVGGVSAAALAAIPAGAQQASRTYRIGVLSPLTSLGAGPYLAVLRSQLTKHGYVEGRNLSIEVRHPEFGREAVMAAAAELVALKPDAILAFTTALAQAATRASNSLPIVFAWVPDPVGTKLVADLAKPGGNVTGVTNRYFELAAKRVEVLRELLPAAGKVAVIAGYFDPVLEIAMRGVESAAERLGLRLVRVNAGQGWESVVPTAVGAGVDALMVMTPFAVFGMRPTAEQVVAAHIRSKMPAIFSDVETVELGGLMSYATNLGEDVRRAANLLVRVLKGEKPAALPVDQASSFELAINLRTARAIDRAIPRSLLVRADRVIE
jgi:putative ABC transport system substrate-binding protein